MARQPPFPSNHFSSAAAFGKFLWGHGAEDAAKRLETIRLSELEANGVTDAIVIGCRDFYAEAILREQGGQTAQVRKQLMEKCLGLLHAGKRGTND